MNLIKSAESMHPFIERLKVLSSSVYGDNSTSIEHLEEMLMAIETGMIDGEKAHRWLGWIQGVVVCRGGATLEEMKKVNE